MISSLIIPTAGCYYIIHCRGQRLCRIGLVFCHFYRKMMAKELRKALLVATGALHSPTTVLQQESIPCIAHAVSLEI